jgi:CO/xanthine dehydrogenase FAD-binding subunit
MSTQPLALPLAASAVVEIDFRITIASARLALGGVGTIPWRAREAEALLTNDVGAQP